MNNEKVNTLVEHLRSGNVIGFNMRHHHSCIMGEATRAFETDDVKVSQGLATFLEVEDERFSDFQALLGMQHYRQITEYAAGNMYDATPEQAAKALQSWAGGATASEAWESVT